MLKNILLLLIFFKITVVFSQTSSQAKFDYIWPFSKTSSITQAGFNFDFNSGLLSITSFNSKLYTGITNSSICDSNGNLLFYTNGMFVANKNGQLMPHGDSLNYGYHYNQNLPEGYNIIQGISILPAPEQYTLFYIFHLKLSDPPGKGTQLLYSVVDMNANAGLGDVIIKNIRLFKEHNDTLTLGGLSTVRHENNRDWWILVGEQNHQSINRILLTPNGVQELDKQNIGFNFINRDCSSAFSPDGSKYAVLTDSGFLSAQSPLAYHPAAVYDFDRDSGILSNIRRFDFIDTSTWVLGACFSPNSRFLYSTLGTRLFQWDTYSSNFVASMTIVANWDGYKYLNVAPTTFGFPKNGPDGRIYLNAGMGSNFMHIIEHPDNPGIACNVTQRAILLPKPVSAGLPNQPNFRLGNPIGIDDHILNKLFKISPIPNPSSSQVSFEVNIQNNRRSYLFDVINFLGEHISSEYFAPFQGMVRYDVSNLPDGVYLAILRDKHEIIGKTKFIVKH